VINVQFGRGCGNPHAISVEAGQFQFGLYFEMRYPIFHRASGVQCSRKWEKSPIMGEHMDASLCVAIGKI